jgi:hypothetical protein
VGSLADPSKAAENGSGSDVSMCADVAVVLDDRPRVDDRAVAEMRISVHDCGSEDLDATTEARPGRDARRGVDDRRQLEAFGEEALEDSSAILARANAPDAGESVRDAVRAKSRELVPGHDRDAEKLVPGPGAIVVDERGDLEMVGRADRLEKGLRVRAGAEADDRNLRHSADHKAARPLRRRNYPGGL